MWLRRTLATRARGRSHRESGRLDRESAGAKSALAAQTSLRDRRERSAVDFPLHAVHVAALLSSRRPGTTRRCRLPPACRSESATSRPCRAFPCPFFTCRGTAARQTSRQQRRLDHARHDAVHSHALLRHFTRSRTGQSDDDAWLCWRCRRRPPASPRSLPIEGQLMTEPEHLVAP